MKKMPQKKERPGMDRFGRNPIINSVIDGDIGQLKRLIESGEDVNSVDDEKWTPLHFASQAFNQEMIALLLNNKANPNAQDSHGNTPIFRALFNCRGVDTKIFDLFIEKGGDPNLANNAGISALKLADQVSNYDLKKYFRRQ